MLELNKTYSIKEIFEDIHVQILYLKRRPLK